jgi:hypothetical protein
MTDHQKEIAARELCRLRDRDPDESIPGVPGVPYWRIVLREVEAYLQVKAAIEFASERRARTVFVQGGKVLDPPMRR